MKNLLRVLLISVLAMTLVLPLALSASAEEEELAKGYVISSDGYESRWVGSAIGGASYGSWVKTDGEWNGCFQWASNKDKVLYDSEAGTLTFQDGLNYNCKIFPAQGKYITTGGVFFSLDVFYQAPNEDDDPGTNSNFSGMILTDNAGNGDRNLLCVLPDGGVKTNRYNAQESILFEMEEGWNTIIMYIIPYLNDSGTVCNKVYLNVANDKNIVADTKGITQDDLDMYYYSYDYSNGKYFSELGSMFYMKPYANNEASKKDNLTIRNAVIKNLEGGNIPSAEENLYKVVYSGYPEVGYSYVPAGGGSIVISKAYDVAGDGTLDYVPYWTAGEEPNLQFYKPGDTVQIMGNMILKRATESQLSFAELAAAYSKLNIADLERYTYLQIATVYNEIVACQDAIVAGGGDTTSSYYTKSERVCTELEDRMEEIANAADELIYAAAIFNDYNAMIDDRVAAFEEVMGGTYDATYSDECATAINQLNSFSATYEAIYENLAEFNVRIQQLVNADASTERGNIIMGAIENLMVIRRAGIADATLNYDKTLIEEEYNNYLNAELVEFNTMDTMSKKYNFLVDLMGEYNTYKKTMYGEKKRVAVPSQIQSMLDTYNGLVATINDQMIEATTVSSSLQYNSLRLKLMRDMMASIIEQKNELFATEEEED